MNASLRSVAIIADSLRDALEGIESATGIDLHRGRMQAYLHVLDRAAGGEVIDSLELVTAVLECTDVEQASKLRPIVLQRVRHRLSEIAAGPMLAGPGADPGRDLLFELAVASRLTAVDPGVDMDCPSDVALSVGGHRLLVECKRPTTVAAFRRRMLEGLRQLSEHRRQGAVGFGALAIDLSRLINPDNQIFQSATEAEGIEGLYAQIRGWINLISEELVRVHRNARNDAGIHILFFHLRCLAGVGRAPPSVAQIWHAEPLIALDTPEFSLIYHAISRVPGFTKEIYVVDPKDPRVNGAV